MVKLRINQWAKEDRPREKMISNGAGTLSDAELLAILIGSGNVDESAVELMRRILSDCHNNLNELARWDLHRFSQYKGMGPAKSITLMAALELGRRRTIEKNDRPIVKSSQDVNELFYPIMRDLAHEEVWILLLNQANYVMDKIRMNIGGITGSFVDVRLILREALLQKAVSIVLVHNHPSGNVTPSNEDRVLTNRLSEASKTMNIRLLDHLIIGCSSYFSFADENLL